MPTDQSHAFKPSSQLFELCNPSSWFSFQYDITNKGTIAIDFGKFLINAKKSLDNITFLMISSLDNLRTDLTTDANDDLSSKGPITFPGNHLKFSEIFCCKMTAAECSFKFLIVFLWIRVHPVYTSLRLWLFNCKIIGPSQFTILYIHSVCILFSTDNNQPRITSFLNHIILADVFSSGNN